MPRVRERSVRVCSARLRALDYGWRLAVPPENSVRVATTRLACLVCRHVGRRDLPCTTTFAPIPSPASKPRAGTHVVIALGQSRWDIESQSFNEFTARLH